MRSVYQDRCIYCRGHDVEGCHVFASTDDNFHNSRRYRLVNIDHLGSKDNAVPLCVSCHRAFDRPWRPKLIIIPQYLDFFFSVEKKWQAAVIDADITEQPIILRVPPTSTDYMVHCLSKGNAGTITRGGLYACFADREYLGHHPEQVPVITQWRGDPMAMLYRAMDAAHKIVRPEGLPARLRTQLLDLRRLYEKGNNIMDTVLERQAASMHSPSQSGSFQPDIHNTRQEPHQPHLMPPPSHHRSLEVEDWTRGYNTAHGHHRHYAHTTDGIISPPPTHTPSHIYGKRKRSCSSNLDTPQKKRALVNNRLSAASLQSMNSTPDSHQHVTSYLQSLDSTILVPEPEQASPNNSEFNPEFNADTKLMADTVSNHTSSSTDTQLKRQCYRWEGMCANDAVNYWQNIIVAASKECWAAARTQPS